MHENINYDVLFDEVESILNTPRGDFEGARQKLLDALDFENPILEPGKKQVGFSFGNIVEETLFYKRFNQNQTRWHRSLLPISSSTRDCKISHSRKCFKNS